MADRISPELLVAHAPVNRGVTENINHEDCPAGEDTRRRLYITRTQDDKVLAYCHNCGSKGYLGPKGITNIRYEPIQDTSARVGNIFHELEMKDLPTVFSLRTGLPDVGKYLAEYQLELDECVDDGWMWSAWGGQGSSPQGSLVFPSFRPDGRLMGLQFKALDPDHKPKCMTHGKMGNHIYNPHDSNHLVIVEDRISAVKVVAKCGVASMCLHGARELSLEDAHKVAMMFDYATVWYDNDNDHVLKMAKATLDKLKMFMGHNAKWYSAGPSPTRPKIDPKNFETDFMRDILKWPTFPS